MTFSHDRINYKRKPRKTIQSLGEYLCNMIIKENHGELSLEKSFYTLLNVAFESASRTSNEKINDEDFFDKN